MNANIWGLLGPEARHQALYSGLLNLGGGLIAAGAPTTQPGMSARGLIAGTQGFNDAINDRQQIGMRSLLVQKSLADAQRKEEAQKARQAAIAQLAGADPRMQALGQVDPRALVDRAVPKPPEDYTLGDTRFRGGTNEPIAYNVPRPLPTDVEEQRRRIAGAGAPSTRISLDNTQLPAPKEGWMYLKEGNTVRMVPIPGGPVDRAQGEQTTQTERAGGIVLDAVKQAFRIMDDPSGVLPTTGAGGQFLQNIGGTRANDLRATVNTIKANAAFDRLQQMRQSSPTGGALGAVSKEELTLLESAIASLDQSQSDKAFRRNLRNVANTYNDIIHGKGKGPERFNLDAEDAKPTSGPKAVPNQAAINHLKLNPALRDQFDAKYGEGAAAKVLGR